MLINKITNIDNKYKTNFCAKPQDFSKLLNSFKLEEQINKNPEKRELFTTLTTVAGAIITEVMLFAEENKQFKNFLNDFISEIGLNKNIEQKKQANKTIKTNCREKESYNKNIPERDLYLKITSYFPKLDNKYKQLLKTHIDEPDNKQNECTLDILESIFKYMTENNRLNGMKSYLLLLNDYADDMEYITENISSTLKNGNSFMYYLVLLNNGKLTKDEIKTWAEANQLSCDEFMMLKKLKKDSLVQISNLKKDYPYFSIKEFDNLGEKYNQEHFAFKLDFKEGIPLSLKLKTVANIHTAIYGEIYLKENKEDDCKTFLQKDIQSEMIDNILKDGRMESVYNFAKFISPKDFEHINLTSNDVKFLDKKDESYKKIKEICSNILFGLDYENPNLKEFCDVINNNDIFGDILATKHSRIRFISRFVLKNNHKPPLGLEVECCQKMDILEQALDDELSKCNYFCYIHSKGLAPQFYLKNKKIGNFTKITLNNNGTIHTIYEDAKKELKLLTENK